MSNILVKLDDGYLNISKIRARQTETDFETVLLSDLIYGKFYTSYVKITNETFYNKILFFQELTEQDLKLFCKKEVSED